MAEPMGFTFYANGEFVPEAEGATFLQAEQDLTLGGLYDAERTFGGKLFRLSQHLDRLYRTVETAGLDPGKTKEELSEITRRVVELNLPLLGAGEELHVRRLVALIGDPAGSSRVNLVVDCRKLDFTVFARGYVRGVRLVTPATYWVPNNAVQTSLVESGQQTMALGMDGSGNITECEGANMMFANDGRVKLPDRRNVLPGVSMATVLELAGRIGISVDEGDYSPAHLYECDEAFVTSTRFCLLPVATLNSLVMGDGFPGMMTSRLLDAWSEEVGVDIVKQALAQLPVDRRPSR